VNPDQFLEYLERLQQLTSQGGINFDRLFADAMSRIFYQGVTDSFVQEAEPDYANYWTPLSPRYAAWKEVYYPGNQILELTGALARQATGADPHVLAGPNGMTWWVDLPYAAAHQYGTDRLPAREYFGASEETLDRMAVEIDTQITNLIMGI
jgi:phage gpG-like protein